LLGRGRSHDVQLQAMSDPHLRLFLDEHVDRHGHVGIVHGHPPRRFSALSAGLTVVNDKSIPVIHVVSIFISAHFSQGPGPPAWSAGVFFS